MIRGLWAWLFPASPDERICPDTGEVCRVGVCNYTPNSPCENLAVKSVIGEVVPRPGEIVYIEKLSVLDDFHDRLKAGEPFREAWAAANGMPELFDDSETDTIEMCWNAINEHIVRGPLPGNGIDKTAERNGMVLATNILSDLMRDAELMSRADIRYRRREAIKMYRVFRFYKELGEHNYRVTTTWNPARYATYAPEPVLND